MPEQLNFFGQWERVEDPPPAPEPPAPELPPTPVDPRQTFLFDGPHRPRLEMEQACERLDAEGVRAAWRAAVARVPDWEPAALWPRWAEDLEYLVGTETAPIPAREQVTRARALRDRSSVGEGASFEGMGEALRARVGVAALERAVARLTELEGPAARLEDGSFAAALLLGVRAADHAVATLADAVRAAPSDGRLRALHAEALALAGRHNEALVACRDACLHDPLALEGLEPSCPAVLDLLDAATDLDLPEPACAWLPVLADLQGRLHLPAWATPAPEEASVARVVAAQLADYRLRRQRDGDEPGRIAAKRAILRLEPRLKELVRRL